MAVAALLGACGEGESSDANERAGTYEVRVTEASFPTEQQLGQTSLLRIGVRNGGDKALPSLAVTLTVGGKQGLASGLPFAVRDRQPGLAQPDRPVWVLSAGYPKLTGVSGPGGASTSNPKTFDFGPLGPGEAATAIWKLSAVKAGNFDLLYQVDASLSGAGKAKTSNGLAPGGTFSVDIASKPLNTEVTDDGEIVVIEKGDSMERPRDRARVIPRSEGE